jgi:hypothetical protein
MIFMNRLNQDYQNGHNFQDYIVATINSVHSQILFILIQTTGADKSQKSNKITLKSQFRQKKINGGSRKSATE